MNQHPAFAYDCIEPGAPVRPAALLTVLCQSCYENGDFDTMLPGSGPHDADQTWGVAEVESDDQREKVITWHKTGLTLAEAEALL